MMMENAGNALAAALAKAQGEMKNAGLNKVNPHFKSKYADLPTIRDAVTGVLSKHGLANRPAATAPKAQPPQQPTAAPEPANGKRALDWPSVQARNVPKDLMAETLASGMSECIRMAEDAGELAQLEQENKTALDWLAKAVPAGHAQIKRQIAARLDEIANGPNAMAGI
jgi:hypothetical protein